MEKEILGGALLSDWLALDKSGLKRVGSGPENDGLGWAEKFRPVLGSDF